MCPAVYLNTLKKTLKNMCLCLWRCSDREIFFLLRASGNSMIEAGIEPGDLVVVRKQNTAEEGDIVVALVDNETTLKRFYRDKKHRCCRLHPENSKMKDIYVQDCTIQGVAQNVIKTL